MCSADHKAESGGGEPVVAAISRSSTDRLVTRWNAPSCSALVEQALRFTSTPIDGL
jgi:hypothetical protein